jgi:hypothetical protein
MGGIGSEKICRFRLIGDTFSMQSQEYQLEIITSRHKYSVQKENILYIHHSLQMIPKNNLNHLFRLQLG